MKFTGPEGQADAMLAALTILTTPDLPEAFHDSVGAGELNHGLGVVIHEAVGRISLETGRPMAETAREVFARFDRTATGPRRTLLVRAAAVMGASWRGDVAALAAMDPEHTRRALTLLASELLQEESSRRGVSLEDVAADYRDRALRLSVGG